MWRPRWRQRRLFAAAVAAATLSSCEAASTDSGLGTLLRVEGAQWTPGAPPNETDGPAVATVRNARTTVWPGQPEKSITGTLSRQASAVSLMLEGDGGHWILPAGPPDAQSPAELTFTARIAFSPKLPLGPLVLLVQAVTSGNRFGPPWREPLLAQSPVQVSGALVISLRWDTEADLDLHVIDPQGIEVWARNINSYQTPPPGQPEDPEAWRRGGILDFDSNAGCAIDGRRRENVIWAESAPAGTYLVRVDAASLCGEAAARWTIEVTKAGLPAGHATGTLVQANTRGKHAQGSGLSVLTFNYP